MFAATKADHLHQSEHDKLEVLLEQLVSRAIAQAQFAGAKVDVLALASVRATREAVFKDDGETLNCITGIPMAGEEIDGISFDGETEKAIFPGSLDMELSKILKQEDGGNYNELQFVRFRPPHLEKTTEGLTLSLPHIRLDRALEFLLGDKVE